MKFILAKKEYMTQVFDEAGRVHPVTVLSTAPMTVTQIKTLARDGYTGVQVATGIKKEKKLTKALKGHFAGRGNFANVKEYRLKTGDAPEVGSTYDASIFTAGDTVSVSGISKGKGFQGVVKRHGFHGGPRSHGQKHSEREPGSIGGGLRNKVPKGMRMGGRMGSDRITTRNLKIVEVNAEEGRVLVRGAVPGRRGTLVEIKSK